MLKKIAGPLKVRRGQTVHIQIKIKPDRISSAVCPLFFSDNGVSLSPHIPAAIVEANVDGKSMLRPTCFMVTEGRPEIVRKVIADEDGEFVLYHDVDLHIDPTAKARIWKDGPFRKLLDQARRWLGGNARR